MVHVAVGSVHEPETLAKGEPTLEAGTATYPAQLLLTSAACADPAASANARIADASRQRRRTAHCAIDIKFAAEKSFAKHRGISADLPAVDIHSAVID